MVANSLRHSEWPKVADACPSDGIIHGSLRRISCEHRRGVYLLDGQEVRNVEAEAVGIGTSKFQDVLAGEQGRDVGPVAVGDGRLDPPLKLGTCEAKVVIE